MSSDLNTINQSGGARFLRVLKKNISISAFIIIFVLFSASLGTKFLNLNNLQVVLEQSIVLFIVSFGLTFIIVLGGIDLSVGSVLALAGVIAASVLKITNNTGLALIAGIITGALCGTFNGFVHTKLKVPSFIVTLGMLSIARALSIIYSKGSVVMIPFESTFKKLGLSPWIIFIGIFFFIIVFILHKFTIFGRYTRMIGGDENVAILCGINVDKYKTLNFILCGVLAGIGGILLTARIGAGSPASGQGFELDAISAVVLGGTPLTGGIGGTTGTVLGVLILSMLSNGLILLGISTEVQMLVKGLVLIIAVFISLERGKIGVIK
ncbi:MAG: ABC transporter permease [Candidatus Humimicrobiaceae bacterium]